MQFHNNVVVIAAQAAPTQNFTGSISFNLTLYTQLVFNQSYETSSHLSQSIDSINVRTQLSSCTHCWSCNAYSGFNRRYVSVYVGKTQLMRQYFSANPPMFLIFYNEQNSSSVFQFGLLRKDEGYSCPSSSIGSYLLTGYCNSK